MREGFDNMANTLYWFTKGTVHLFLKIVFRIHIEGKENIPLNGSFIAAANHVSALDPPVLASSINRQVFFMAKEELFKNPFIGWYFKTIGTFPVRRGMSDRGAIKKALQILNDGNVLGIFPEGTRKSGEIQMGVVMMALKTNSPILPVALHNTDRRVSRGPIRVFIGKPFTLVAGDQKPSKEERKEMAERVMKSIRDLG